MPRYIFGPFSLDPEIRVLLRHGEPIALTGKALDTLLVLVERRGRLVDKDELLSRLWPGTVVEEANLSQSIFAVRKILGDTPKDHRYIATVAGRGYQFVAPVIEEAGRLVAGERVQKRPHWYRDRIIQLGVVAVVVALIATAWFIWSRPRRAAFELTQRRLTFNSGANAVASAAISPDGNYVAYSDRTGIHLKLLSTGEERHIPPPGGMSAGAISYIDAWFPDGTQLLAHSKQADDYGSMWTVSVMGQSQREFRGDASGWDISADGKRIAFSPNRPFDTYREIWVMDSQGHNAEKILGLPANESLCSARWSPDGQRLAYCRVQRLPDKYVQYVESCDLKGTDRKAVVVASGEGPWVESFAWLREGRIVYSRQESPGSSNANLWQVAVDVNRGTTLGKPKRLTSWAESNLVGLSATENRKRVALRKVTYQRQIYLSELTARGTQMSPPRRLTPDEADNSPTAWTPDSKAVLFTSDRYGTPHLFKRDISSDNAEPLVMDPNTTILLARLSPDGRWVLYIETSGPPAPGKLARLMRIPVNGGFPQLVLETKLEAPGWYDFQCSRGSSNICVIDEVSGDQNRLSLTAFDPVKGRGRLLRSLKIPFNAINGSGISPDGSTFAIARRVHGDPHIVLVSLSGGFDREIAVTGWPNIDGLDWSADGKGFYCGSISPEGSTLLHVDLKGNAQTLWRDREATRPDVAGIPSPDGRYLAMWGSAYTSNVWLIEGFE